MTRHDALGVLLLSLLGIAGCASVPMASKEDDGKAKQFAAPADKGRIYVYRNETFGSAIKIPITLDGKMMGQTAKDTYFVFDVAPGTHEVGCVAESSSNVSLTTAAGKSMYVWQEMKMGAFSAGCVMHEVDESTGQKAVATCNLAK